MINPLKLEDRIGLITAYHVKHEPVTSFQENFRGRLDIHRALGNSIELPAIKNDKPYKVSTVLSEVGKNLVKTGEAFGAPGAGKVASLVSKAGVFAGAELYMHSIRSVEEGLHHELLRKSAGARIIEESRRVTFR